MRSSTERGIFRNDPGQPASAFRRPRQTSVSGRTRPCRASGMRDPSRASNAPPPARAATRAKHAQGRRLGHRSFWRHPEALDALQPDHRGSSPRPPRIAAATLGDRPVGHPTACCGAVPPSAMIAQPVRGRCRGNPADARACRSGSPHRRGQDRVGSSAPAGAGRTRALPVGGQSAHPGRSSRGGRARNPPAGLARQTRLTGDLLPHGRAP